MSILELLRQRFSILFEKNMLKYGKKGWVKMDRKIVKYKNSVAVFLDGELDQYAAAEIKSKIDVEMENSDKKNLIIDLSKVTLMDSSGIGLIIGRYKRLGAIGGKVAISGGNSGIRKVIDLSGIKKIIPYFENADEADKSFKDIKNNGRENE